jgi:hypothetical protein
MATLTWSMTVQVSGSSSISISRAPIAVEATDRIEVLIAPGDTAKVVEIQPGVAAAVHALVVTSTSYGSHLKFVVNDGTTDSSAVTLDSPQVFSGGSIAVFGVAPRRLKFTNTSADKPATVEVLVARDATP